MASMTVGTVTLNARQSSGTAFFFNNLDDWYTLPDSKAAQDAVPDGPGDFDGGEDWPASALFSVGGFARGATRLDAIQMQDQLNAVRSLAGLTAVTVTDEDGPWTRQCSIVRIKWSDQKKERIIPFVIDFRSPDPNRYGTPLSPSTGLPVLAGGFRWGPTGARWPAGWGTGGDPGRVVEVNTGSQATTSLYAVTGGLSGGFSILNIEDGQTIRLEREVPLGSTAYVDPTTGRAWLDVPENDISTFLTAADWWEVPPMSFRTLQFNSIGTVTGSPHLTSTTAPAKL